MTLPLLAGALLLLCLSCFFLLRRLHSLVPTKGDVERQGIHPEAEYTLTTTFKGRHGPKSPHIQITLSGQELAALLAFVERLGHVK